METAGWILVGLGIVLPIGVVVVSAIDRVREDRKHGGLPPLDDAFGPAANVIDTALLILLAFAFLLPGVALVLFG